ncbi:zinc-binding dehydrogenase [Nitrospinota bacterium]
MRALVFRGKGQLTVEDVEEPQPAPGEVLVQVERCGVCGSDLVTYDGRRKVPLPLVQGHEFVGVIHAIEGKSELPFRPGDRVVAEPTIGCGMCRHCRSGNYNVCEERKILGAETDGAFAQFVRVPLLNLLRVPEGMPVAEAALVQPAAVAVRSVSRGSVPMGASVAVLGAGPIGALIAMVVRAAGAIRVALVEPNPFRRELMQSVGFRVIDPTQEDPVAAVAAECGEDDGCDVVFDAAGTRDTPAQATRMVRTQGRVVLVAQYREEPWLDIGHARKREVNFISIRAHNYEDYRAALALIASRRVDVRPLVTHELTLDDMPRMFKTLGEGGGPLMKVLCKP